ncbi:SufE family protein [Carboxylicivirga sp. M1479]|uniref:SufE family protein n=1 Tax=Carboxylicivirga sp. M1479 TaxID=2594476 RepID=UPI001177F494|nr:SufE family protein [Carboxylicivirga sp. M1479]TRX64567.1 SufE family protein [Carboxylicivirga sp. M1479]
MTINEVQEEIVEEFASFDEWMDKYAYLIEIGNDLEGFKDEWRLEQNLIEGCQSKVWVYAELVDGKINYSADSDAIITKGIIALLIRVLSGRTPDEILNTELSFVEKVGLKDHLSPTRSNGLLSMMKQMRLYAVAFKAKQG